MPHATHEIIRADDLVYNDGAIAQATALDSLAQCLLPLHECPETLQISFARSNKSEKYENVCVVSSYAENNKWIAFLRLPFSNFQLTADQFTGKNVVIILGVFTSEQDAAYAYNKGMFIAADILMLYKIDTYTNLAMPLTITEIQIQAVNTVVKQAIETIQKYHAIFHSGVPDAVFPEIPDIIDTKDEYDAIIAELATPLESATPIIINPKPILTEPQPVQHLVRRVRKIDNVAFFYDNKVEHINDIPEIHGKYRRLLLSDKYQGVYYDPQTKCWESFMAWPLPCVVKNTSTLIIPLNIQFLNEMDAALAHSFGVAALTFLLENQKITKGTEVVFSSEFNKFTPKPTSLDKFNIIDILMQVRKQFNRVDRKRSTAQPSAALAESAELKVENKRRRKNDPKLVF